MIPRPSPERSAHVNVTIFLPELGEAVTEGTISRWLVQPGDTVDMDSPLVEVATDKVDTEIPATAAGTIVELLVAEDDVVAVGARIALIRDDAGAEPKPPEDDTTVEAAPATAPAPRVSALGNTPAPAAATTQVAAHPGPAAAPPPVSPLPIATADTRSPVAEPNTMALPRIRQTIARRMVESVHTAAHVTTVVEVDVTTIAQQRRHHGDEIRRRTGVKLSFLPFFARAAVLALESHPLISATINAEATSVTYHPTVALGIAVDGPKGLMVPVIRDAAALSIEELAAAITSIADRVRSATISPDELTGGTFTITNTGSRGALFDTPIINQPQLAILGTGAVVERVVPRRSSDGDLSLSVRSMVYLSLSYDHRMIDGADAARYLRTVKEQLESGFAPEELP